MAAWICGLFAGICILQVLSIVIVVKYFLQHIKSLNEYVFVDQKVRIQETGAKLETHKQELADVKRYNDMTIQAQQELIQERSKDPDPEDVGPNGNFRSLPHGWGVDGAGNQ